MRSASLLVLQKSLKSSAYRTMKTFFKPVALNALYRSDGPLYCLWDWNVSHWLDIHQSSSFRTTFANNGLRIPPCGTPFSGIPTPAMGAFSILERTRSNCLSCMPSVQSCFNSFPWLTLSKNPLISTSTTKWKPDWFAKNMALAMAWCALRFGRNP